MKDNLAQAEEAKKKKSAELTNALLAPLSLPPPLEPSAPLLALPPPIAQVISAQPYPPLPLLLVRWRTATKPPRPPLLDLPGWWPAGCAFQPGPRATNAKRTGAPRSFGSQLLSCLFCRWLH